MFQIEHILDFRRAVSKKNRLRAPLHINLPIFHPNILYKKILENSVTHSDYGSCAIVLRLTVIIAATAVRIWPKTLYFNFKIIALEWRMSPGGHVWHIIITMIIIFISGNQGYNYAPLNTSTFVWETIQKMEFFLIFPQF